MTIVAEKKSTNSVGYDGEGLTALSGLNSS